MTKISKEAIVTASQETDETGAQVGIISIEQFKSIQGEIFAGLNVLKLEVGQAAVRS